MWQPLQVWMTAASRIGPRWSSGRGRSSPGRSPRGAPPPAAPWPCPPRPAGSHDGRWTCRRSRPQRYILDDWDDDAAAAAAAATAAAAAAAADADAADDDDDDDGTDDEDDDAADLHVDLPDTPELEVGGVVKHADLVVAVQPVGPVEIEDGGEGGGVPVEVELVVGEAVGVDEAEDVLVGAGLGQLAEPSEGSLFEELPSHLDNTAAFLFCIWQTQRIQGLLNKHCCYW